MTPRYEPKTQAFGLEPKACSRYGWEFFLGFIWGFSSFSEPRRETQIEISGNFQESFELRRNLSFSFRSGISRSEIENFPTEDHEGVQIGSGGNPDNDERATTKV